MFYQGSLQEGISSAVEQQKMVFCFVANDSEESRAWENDFLLDSSLRGLIEGQAVALRLMTGSEEAEYLSQIFPLPQTPTVVIMKHGELKEYIASGTTKNDFIRRVQTTFNTSAPAPAQASEQAASVPQADASSAPPRPDTESSDDIHRVLAERAAKLEAQKKEAERKAKEERTKAKGKGRAEAESGADTSAARAHQQAEMLKQRRQEGFDQRRRILRLIEDDKENRRLRAAQRAQRPSYSVTAGGIPLVNVPPAGDKVSIQVRLFDGSTMRNTQFKKSSTLQDVRAWVDKTRTDGRQPFTFRHLLTPSPNRTIDATEEHMTLVQLRLSPSATLILVPVPKFASAYEAKQRSRSILSQVLGAIMGFFTWFMGLCGLGGSSTREQTGAPAAAVPESSQRPAQSRSRGQDAYDQRTDHQLYNGNSLNFEPRPDEEGA